MKLGDFIPSGNLVRSTADQVSEILRQAVIGRVFEAGERLVESRIAADLYGSMENPIETTRCFLLILDAVLLGLSFFVCDRIEAAGVRPKPTDCPDRTSGTDA